MDEVPPGKRGLQLGVLDGVRSGQCLTGQKTVLVGRTSQMLVLGRCEAHVARAAVVDCVSEYGHAATWAAWKNTTGKAAEGWRQGRERRCERCGEASQRTCPCQAAQMVSHGAERPRQQVTRGRKRSVEARDASQHAAAVQCPVQAVHYGAVQATESGPDAAQDSGRHERRRMDGGRVRTMVNWTDLTDGPRCSLDIVLLTEQRRA